VVECERERRRGCGFGFGVGAMGSDLAWLGWAGTDIIWTMIVGSANRGVLVLVLVEKVTAMMK